MDGENKKLNILNDKNIKVIHTYSSDMADAVRENEVSVIKIALAEKEKREREEIYKKAEGTGFSKTLLVIGGLILIGAAIAAGYFVLQKNKKENTPPPIITKEIPSLISYDDKSIIDITTLTDQAVLATKVKAEVTKPGKPGTVRVLFLNQIIGGVNHLFPIANVFSTLDITPPGPLARTLNEPYMLGIYTPTGENPRPHLFLILQIKDYNQAYASLLVWEKTMLENFSTLFSIDASGERQNLLQKPWADIIIKNKNGRILYDRIGNDILFYLLDRETLIISDNQDTIKEILVRLRAKEVKPL